MVDTNLTHVARCCVYLALSCAILLEVNCQVTSDQGQCQAESSCKQTGATVPGNLYKDGGGKEGHAEEDVTGSKEKAKGDDLTNDFILRSMQGLEGMFDQVANSKEKMLESIDTMMDKMSQSRDQVIASLSESRAKVMEKIREGIDKVAHSKVMEEIDLVIEMLAHSKVMEEIRALPREIRESFILSVRNRSYLISGLMVAVAAAILFSGAVYYAWCHHDAWSYHIGTIEEAKALLKKARDSAEKCVSSATMASGSDFPSELCNMTSRGCQGEGFDPSRGDAMKGDGVDFKANGEVIEEALQPPSDSTLNRDGDGDDITRQASSSPASVSSNGRCLASGDDLSRDGGGENVSSSQPPLETPGQSLKRRRPQKDSKAEVDSTVSHHLPGNQNGDVSRQAPPQGGGLEGSDLDLTGSANQGTFVCADGKKGDGRAAC